MKDIISVRTCNSVNSARLYNLEIMMKVSITIKAPNSKFNWQKPMSQFNPRYQFHLLTLSCIPMNAYPCIPVDAYP